jgi:hypothetical protein
MMTENTTLGRRLFEKLGGQSLNSELYLPFVALFPID